MPTHHLSSVEDKVYLKPNSNNQKKTKDGLISFNNILSANRDRYTNKIFSNNGHEDSNTAGTLSILNIDPSVSKTPFASITDASYYSSGWAD
ncbi:unnamed protein product [Adineta ricciae]|uniref:Uncharacterized protein n=1 Tax=Adineta ricciae TaxID=249248 RepID=A0A814JBX1_ADIRI|nr:unnamed protein product [Adineta ricciae]CAF1441229.1 unnamed protein product [Adineta ricciae]